MGFRIEKVTKNQLDDLAKLFGAEPVTNDCWCMWYITSVKDFYAAGSAGNREKFCQMVEDSDLPMGLLAFQDNAPVGWCAVGPRTRYVRALNTPTYRGGEEEDGNVWLVPCFYVRKDVRGQELSRHLLEAAVDLAKENGASAIEGFPYSGSKRRSGGAIQVGFEAVFSACGFRTIRTPSPSRVVMRRQLNGET